MVNKSKRRIFISVLALVVTMCLSLSTNYNTAWAAEDADAVYNDNKTLVQTIDKNDYFTQLYNLSFDDNSYVLTMQSVVNVAKAYDELNDSFASFDYEKEDYDKILKVLNQTKLYVSLTEENYLVYADKEAKYLERIAKEKTYLTENFITAQTKLTNYSNDVLNAVEDKKTMLLSKSASQDTLANQVVGSYDSDAQNELEKVYQDGLKEFAATVTFNTEDMAGSKAKMDELKNKIIDAMLAVKKNNVERAYDELQDYYAMADGNLEGDKEAQKTKTAEAIKKCDPFFESASADVLKEYSSERKAFVDFFDENPIDDSSFKNRSTLETEDKQVKLEAYVDGALCEIFPTDAKLKAYNIVESSPKRYNAQREIVKNNNQISIAYFVDVLVYYDSEQWKAPTEFEGKQVTYKITIDLNGYYDKYIQNNESFLASVLKNIGIKSGAGQNKAEYIEALAGQFKNDLCYIYYKDGEDGAVKSLNYSLDGGKLMLETNMLGSVAINGLLQASLLTNPIFWVCLILALVLVIIIVVLIFKFAKYTIKFYLSDGTLVAKVKARKGESFVMPVAAKKKGHVFAGWFEDAELKNRFLQTQVTKRKSISVYAKYAKELNATQLTDLYNELCVKLASNSVLGNEFETEQENLTIAKVVKTEEAVKLYVDIYPESIDKEAYGVKLVKADDMFAAPLLKIVDNADAYKQALELIDILVRQFNLKESDVNVEEINGTETYVLTVSKVIPEGPTEEELNDYLQGLRKETLSYALTEKNDKAEDGKILVKAYKQEDGIYMYLDLDAETYGLQAVEDDRAEGTPSLIVVTNEEEFEKAKELIATMMTEFGLEKVIDPSELGEGSSKGFGYRIRFSE